MPVTPRYCAQGRRKQDHLFGVVEHAQELAIHELLGREVRDQQQVERVRIAFAGDAGYGLGIDQQQAEHKQRHQTHGCVLARKSKRPGTHVAERVGHKSEEQQECQSNREYFPTISPSADFAPQNRIGPYRAACERRAAALHGHQPQPPLPRHRPQSAADALQGLSSKSALVPSPRR